MGEQTRARVLILGAGPAGSATAVALRERGVERVVLAEASDFGTRRIGESLLPLARGVLAELGLLKPFDKQGHLQCKGSCSAWGSAQLAYKDYLRTPYGYGWHLDRTRFDAWLATEAVARGAQVLTSTRCVSLAQDGDNGIVAKLRCSGVEQVIVAERLVDATGPRAFASRALGAERRILDSFVCVYGFHGIGERGSNERTLLEASELGWWYAADLPGGEQVVALACEHETVKQLGLRDPDVWAGQLAASEHVSTRVRGEKLSAPLWVRPVSSQRIDTVMGPEFLAVGDAAAAFDPLCSHGITKALTDGRQAGIALADSLSRSGLKNAMQIYSARLAANWDEYCVARDALYQQEHRWPDALFWKRRRDHSHAHLHP